MTLMTCWMVSMTSWPDWTRFEALFFLLFFFFFSLLVCHLDEQETTPPFKMPLTETRKK